MTVFTRRIVPRSGVLALAAILVAVAFYVALPVEAVAAGAEVAPMAAAGATPTGTAGISVTAVMTDVPGAFRFGVAGDMGGVGAAADSFAALAKAKPDFFLAIGDLSYDDIAPEKAWCNFVKKQLGDTYPFEVLVGNHEELPSSKSGFIDNFAKCLPDRLGEQGRYAHRYYFDYPADAPMARFIFIDPDLPRGDADAEYCRSGDKSNCKWLKEAIDEAQSEGLWTIVSMHKVCISAAEKPCEVGGELLNLLLERKVDLVLQGHEHGYQRTKQLSLGADCSELEPGVFDAGCIASDGGDAVFERGAGPVFVVSAAFGQDPYPINLDDPELPYIAVWMDDSNESKGWMEFTVTEDSIDGQFVSVTGPLTDTFTISGPPVTPAATPAIKATPRPTAKATAKPTAAPAILPTATPAVTPTPVK